MTLGHPFLPVILLEEKIGRRSASRAFRWVSIPTSRSVTHHATIMERTTRAAFDVARRVFLGGSHAERALISTRRASSQKQQQPSQNRIDPHTHPDGEAPPPPPPGMIQAILSMVFGAVRWTDALPLLRARHSLLPHSTLDRSFSRSLVLSFARAVPSSWPALGAWPSSKWPSASPNKPVGYKNTNPSSTTSAPPPKKPHNTMCTYSVISQSLAQGLSYSSSSSSSSSSST